MRRGTRGESFFGLLFALLMLILASGISPKFALGQSSSTGTILGLVTDSTGAVVPGAVVTITQKLTGDTRSTSANSAGRYVFVNVDPGTYDVKVTMQGFTAVSFTNQVVRVGTSLTLDAKLQVGTTTTTVEVTTSPGSELQTLNSTVGATIEHAEIMNLPNPSRDATAFAVLQPGVTIGGNTAGAVADQNTFQLDGGTVTDDMSGDNDTYIPSFTSQGFGSSIAGGMGAAPSAVIPAPVDSIEEFKVGVSNQTSDFNGGAGSQVQMETRRGTNAFHGTVYDFYNDNNFGGANTWDNNANGIKQPGSHYSRFGVAAGGPLLPGNLLGGKTFIFGNYEGFRFPFSEIFARNYPLPSLRVGLINLNHEVINLNNVPTTDPTTGVTYAANTGTCVQPTGKTCAPIPGTTTRVAPGGLEPCGTTSVVGGVTTFTPGPCDPRNLGINPVMCVPTATGSCSSGLWSLVPVPNNLKQGDGLNYAGYDAPLALPQTSNFGVVRIDHDFGQKWHFNSTYHYYRLDRSTTNQVDVGGFFPGDTLGNYKSTSNRPQVPWYYTGGVTTNITPTMTNDFHYSGTRNWWAYQTNGGVPNVAGYPAALEPGGEIAGTFAPYNTNNQSTRTRFWNGHDNLFRDDVSYIRGTHLLQFGGSYQRNHDTHQRIDNGGFINIYEQYVIGNTNAAPLSGVDLGASGVIPNGVTSTNKYGNLYSMVLGMVDVSQALYTRGTGTTLPLLPRNSCAISGVAATSGCVASPPAINSSIIPTYNLYFGDSWQMKRNFTLNYGLGYTVEMPPFESSGHQDILVDAQGNELNFDQFLAAREASAFQGVPYNPNIGFATIGNVNGHPKYPYNPFFGGFGPRVSAAWSPQFSNGSWLGKLFGHGDGVIRGGWSRIYGRLNGVDQVLVPILAPGLMQTVQCFGPNKSTGGCGAATGGKTLVPDVYRAGVDGTTAPLAPASANLPQPWYPGVNDAPTGAGEALDPSFRPNHSDEFNISIQRQIIPKVLLEVGYIGRKIHNEFQAYDLNNVPYTMSLAGQTFAQAWANVMQETNFGANPGNAQSQPFFEAALGGTGSAYCGSTSCTAAFVNNEGANGSGNMGIADVWSAWTDVSTAGSFGFGRSMMNDPFSAAEQAANCPSSQPTCGANGQATSIFLNASNGYGNYNAGYFQLTFQDWHGLTMRSNLTMSRALGTGAVIQASSAVTVVDPYHLKNTYGFQPFDQTWVFNQDFTYNLPFYKSQKGAIGKLLGGWSISPVFSAGTGLPDEVNTGSGDASSFGEGSSNDEAAFENAVAMGPVNYSPTRKQNVFGVNAGTVGSGQNVFVNPDAAFALFRNPILGLDGQVGGGGPLRGLAYWNLDMAFSKNVKLTERFNSTVYGAFTNVLNHMQAADPAFSLSDPTTFGVLGGGGNVQANQPRHLEIGMRLNW